MSMVINLTFYVFMSIELSTSKITFFKYKNCKLPRQHFAATSQKTIELLILPNQHEHLVNDFLSDFIKKLLKQNVSIQIGKNHLTNPQKNNQNTIVIGWNANNFYSVLEHSGSFPTSKNHFSFIFIAPEQMPYPRRLFDYFLDGFAVVNVIVQAPCAPDPKALTYRPFVPNGTAWGLLDDNTNINGFQNMNKFPVFIAMFPSLAANIPNIPAFLSYNPIYSKPLSFGNHAGMDAMFVSVFGEYLNFTPVINNEFPSHFGITVINSSSEGNIVSIFSPFAGNTRYFVGQYEHYSDSARPHGNAELCFAVRKAPKRPRWSNVFLVSQKWNVLLVLASFWCGTLFWYFQNHDIVQALEICFHLWLGIPEKFPARLRNFFYLLACLAFNNILLTYFLGSLVVSLASISYWPDVETLSEISKSYFVHIPKLPRKGNTSNVIEHFLVLKNITQRKEIDLDHLYDALKQDQKVAIVDADLNIDTKTIVDFTNGDGTSQIHKVKECLGNVLLTRLVQKNSPFLDVLNQFTTKIFEAGLFKKWYDDIVHYMTRAKVWRSHLQSNKKLTLTLSDLQGCFYCLFALWALSSVLCFFEFLTKKHFVPIVHK